VLNISWQQCGRRGMTKTSLGARRKGRTIALQALFEVDCTGHDSKESLDRLLEGSSLPEETATFARELVLKVLENRGIIDELIRRFAPAWPLQQIAVVDRNILRMGVYEILFKVVPAKVAINEAVELAKTFGSDSSSKFVNGVLGSVYAELTNQKERKEVM
jgi:N utilization substance protein B